MTEARFVRHVKHQQSLGNGHVSDAHDASAAKTPSPTGGGTLVAQVKCGNVVARIYKHDSEQDKAGQLPDFRKTVEFKRQFTQNGKIVESSRLTTDDLGALRDLAKSLRQEEMKFADSGFQLRRADERRTEDSVPKVTGRAAAKLKRDRESGSNGPSSNER